MEKLISIIEESLYGIDPGTVSEGSNIVQLKEWDSLALLSLIDSIDMEFGVLLKKSSPKYLRKATAPPAPMDKTISLLVWSTPCWATLFSISLLTLSIPVAVTPRSLSCFKSFGAYPIKKKGVAGPGNSPANCNISPVVLCGPDLFSSDACIALSDIPNKSPN